MNKADNIIYNVFVNNVCHIRNEGINDTEPVIITKDVFHAINVATNLYGKFCCDDSAFPGTNVKEAVDDFRETGSMLLRVYFEHERNTERYSDIIIEKMQLESVYNYAHKQADNSVSETAKCSDDIDVINKIGNMIAICIENGIIESLDENSIIVIYEDGRTYKENILSTCIRLAHNPKDFDSFANETVRVLRQKANAQKIRQKTIEKYTDITISIQKYFDEKEKSNHAES